MRKTVFIVVVMLLLTASFAIAGDLPSVPTPVTINAPSGGSEINIIVYPPDTSTSTNPSKGTETPEYIDRALNITQSAESYMEKMLTIAGVILALVGLLITIVGGLVTWGWFDIRKIRKEAKLAQEHVDKTKEDIDRLKQEMDTAYKDICKSKDKAEQRAEETNTIKESAEKDAEIIRKNRETASALAPKSFSGEISEDEKHQLDNAVSQVKDNESKLTAVDYFNMAGDLYFKGEYQQAIDNLDKALDIKSDYYEALNDKGTTLAKMDKLNEAIIEYDKALLVNPNYHLSLYSKGTALAKMGNLKEAIIEFNMAIAIKDNFSKAWFNRACTYALLGKTDKALSDLRRAIELDSDYKKDAQDDEDFDSLRDDPEFRKLVGLDDSDPDSTKA